MTRLNKNASAAMVKAGANACTDVTGFGLAGHSMQMAKASNVVFKFFMKKLPVLEGAVKGIGENLLTRGDKSNREYTKEFIFSEGKVDPATEHLAYDPQTSGGLLISVPEVNSDKLLNLLHEGGDESALIVGEVLVPDEKFKPGSVIFEY